jgi:hypothetical protein
MTIALTRAEIARSWLVEHYRRQGSFPVRTITAVAMLAIGIAMVQRGGAPVAWLALAWGAFLVLRPIAFAAWLRFGRAAPPSVDVSVDARGVEIRAAKGARLLPWSDITAWGLGSDYLWYEIRRGPRATIPFRVMDDRRELEAVFRACSPSGKAA